MKIIFLDIDGVMIPYWSAHSYGRSQPFPRQQSDTLNTILGISDAKIVLSSCYGNHFDTPEEIQMWLNNSGVIYFDRVVGKTRHYGNRTESIQLYLEKCECQNIDITNILILDDETIDHPLDKHHVKINQTEGLVESHLAKCFSILDHIPFEEIYE